MEPTLIEISAKLDVPIAAVARLAASKPAPVLRSQYSVAEFAPFCGLTTRALANRPVWKRYGGIKRGGRVMFPESARIAISQGDRP